MKYIETKGAFYCRLLTEALPVTVQSVITIGVNLADNVMLGQLGETALSASALGTQFVSLFQFLCNKFNEMSLCHFLWQTVGLVEVFVDALHQPCHNGVALLFCQVVVPHGVIYNCSLIDGFCVCS